MWSIIKAFLKKIYTHYIVVQNYGHNNSVNVFKKKYRGKLNIQIYGDCNKVILDPSCILNNVSIIIWGNNNEIRMGQDVKIQIGDISLYDGATCLIEHNSTFQGVSIVLKNRSCRIGADCMFSDGIKIRNYDGHKIVDKRTDLITNSPSDIIIGNHVWVGQDVSILKNTEIQGGSIIGCKALVSGFIGQNCIAAGVPAKEIKHNVAWIRH